ATPGARRSPPHARAKPARIRAPPAIPRRARVHTDPLVVEGIDSGRRAIRFPDRPATESSAFPDSRQRLRSAWINCPSFAYFFRTVRAAIREINAPRRPSRNPARSTKFWKKLHGAANHIAPRQLRRPAANICFAASVEYFSTFASCSEKSRIV